MRQIRSFILASGSPRRRRLLEEAGLAFEVAEPAPGAEEAAGPDADAARRALLKARSAATKVRFREIDGETIARYVKSGEPMDKAGAYAIQGAGGSLVDRVEGSYTNVVGLPLAETLAALGRGGVLARAPSRVGGAGMRR